MKVIQREMWFTIKQELFQFCSYNKLTIILNIEHTFLKIYINSNKLFIVNFLKFTLFLWHIVITGILAYT